MIAGIYNIEMEQGSTFERVLRVSDALGAPYSFVGYTVRMKIRTNANVVAWDSEAENNGGSIAFQNNNEIYWRLEAATTANFKFDEAKYDIEIMQGTNVYKIIRGKILLIKESTR